jgi:hypothetical protein
MLSSKWHDQSITNYESFDPLMALIFLIKQHFVESPWTLDLWLTSQVLINSLYCDVQIKLVSLF